MTLALTIDLGTTNLKAGLVSDSGEIINYASRELTGITSSDGGYEHDPSQLWSDVLSVCKEVCAERSAEVAVVVSSSYHFGMLLLDGAMNPLTGISTLLDTRAMKTQGEFLDEHSPRVLYERTGCPPFFQYQLPRLYFLKRRDPSLLNRTSHILSSKSFLLYKMTGELLTDPSIESATQLLSIRTLQWDDDSLRSVGLKSSQFPTLVPAYRDLLPLSNDFRLALGIPESARAIVGVYDGGALGIALGGLTDGVGVLNLGTSAMLRLSGKAPVFDADNRFRFQVYYLTDGRYFVGGSINNAALPLRWLRDNVFGLSYDELLAVAETSPIGARGVLFIPYLTGERDWQIAHVATGSFFGLRLEHTKAEMIRAVLEGPAFSLAQIQDALFQNELRANTVRVGGGGARYSPWRQILANVLAKELVPTTSQEPSLLGNAALGFTAIRRFSSLSDAVSQLVMYEPPVVPSEEAIFEYEKHLKRFCAVSEAFRPLYAFVPPL